MRLLKDIASRWFHGKWQFSVFSVCSNFKDTCSGIVKFFLSPNDKMVSEPKYLKQK
jgi:hypothetical protein